MTPELDKKIVKAAEALCRMQNTDPDKRVSETIRMTWREHNVNLLTQLTQQTFALAQAGVIDTYLDAQ